MIIQVDDREWFKLGSSEAILLGKLRAMATEKTLMLSIGELAEECCMSYNNVSRLLKELKGWGYLEHITNEKGNRIIGVRLL